MHYREEQLDQALDTLTALQLVRTSNGSFTGAAQGSKHHQSLNLLASLVTQTLERMFIVISLLQHRAQTIESLRTDAQLIAQKVSRIYGINAPEFFDQRLFDQFIERLLANQVVCENDDGTLNHDPIIERVLRAAEFVIDPEIRYAVLSEANPT